MSKEKQANLENLKSQILSDLVPLVDNAGMDPEQKFIIVLASARASGDLDTLAKARQIALTISDPTAQFQALQSLLGEVDVAINDTMREPEPEHHHAPHHPEHHVND